MPNWWERDDLGRITGRYSKEGEDTYLVPFERGSHKVTITEEEREMLKTENWMTWMRGEGGVGKTGEFWNKTLARFLYGSDDAEFVARIKAMPEEDKKDWLLNKKKEEWTDLCLDNELKRAILREEWDEKNKKGKSFLAKLRQRNPYYEPKTADSSGIG